MSRPLFEHAAGPDLFRLHRHRRQLLRNLQQLKSAAGWIVAAIIAAAWVIS